MGKRTIANLFRPISFYVLLVLASYIYPTNLLHAQNGTVLSEVKISAADPNFKGTLGRGEFGRSICSIGDLDGDGISDIVVGYPVKKNVKYLESKTIWVLYLNADGSVKSKSKLITVPADSSLLTQHRTDFGCSIASFSDLNGNKIPYVVIGAASDDENGLGKGAIWLSFINLNGTVKSQIKLGAKNSYLEILLDSSDNFGCSVATFKDLNGDNVADIAVGACRDDDGNGHNRGAVYILFLKPNGDILKYQKISQTEGNFKGSLSENDLFGTSLANIGDLNNDGVEDLAVGSYFGDGSNPKSGAVWILFLNSDGSVKSHYKITVNKQNYQGNTSSLEFFGKSITCPGDLDQDGIQDLIIGANDKKMEFTGELWVAFLKRDGSVKSFQKIGSSEGGFDGELDVGDQFGQSLAAIGDIDKNGIPDIAVGAVFDDDGGPNRGAVWILKMAKAASFKGSLMFNYDNPVADLEFRLLNNLGRVLQVTRTNEVGAFEFDNLTLGKKYIVELNSDEISLSDKARMYIQNDKGENVLIIPRSEDNNFTITPKARKYYNRLNPLPSSDNRLLTITVKGQLFDQQPGDLPDGASVFITNQEQEVLFATTIDDQGNFSFNRQSPKERYSIRSMVGEGELKLLVKNKHGEIIFEARMDQNGKIIYDRFKPGEKTISFKSVDNETITVRHGKKFNLNIYFKPANSTINNDAAAVLDKVVSLLKRNSQIAIEIAAHTDSNGSDAANLALSYKRAEQVLKYVYKKGIEIKRISGKGYGETQLLNKCDDGVPCTEAEHKMNRRVELIIRKLNG